MVEKKNIGKDALLVFLVGLALFCTVNSTGEFVQYKSRFGLFAREMIQHGVSPYPTVYGKPYPDYTAVQTILIWLVSRVFGEVTFFTSVFPTAMAAALTLCIIYLIGATHSRRFGACAVLFELGTFFFFSTSRTPSPDHFLTTVTALCFYIVYSSDIYHARKRLRLLPLVLAAGFAVRGPIGLVVPASVVWIYFMIVKDWRRLFRFSLHALALLVLCSFLLLYLAYLQGGMEFLHHVLNSQALGRVVNERPKPLYYYIVGGLGSYAIAFPVFILVLTAYWRKLWKGDRDKNVVLFKALAGWAFIILAGLSIPAAKKTRYILPIAPAISLAAAYLFLDVHKSELLFKVRAAVIKFCRLAPFFCATFVLTSYFVLKSGLISETLLKKYVSLDTSVVSSLVPFLVFVLLGIVTLVLQKKFPDGKSQEFACFAAGISCLVVAHIFVIEPVNFAFESTKPFITKVEPFRDKKDALVFYRVGPDGDDVKYVANLDKIVTPVFTSDPREILQLEQGEVVITGKENFSELPESVLIKIEKIAEGRIGHHMYVAFKVNNPLNLAVDSLIGHPVPYKNGSYQPNKPPLDQQLNVNQL
jgi:4-amino-4-deoxy-L-arabinose transferase-like glycosyltransferase